MERKQDQFEKKLNEALLCLAYQHHIPKLFIKHANTAVRGPTDDPQDQLFKKFNKSFGSINLDNRTLYK